MSLIRLGSAATRRQQASNDARDAEPVQRSATATMAETETATEKAFQQLVQYIPTETVTLFMAAVSVVNSLDHIPVMANLSPLWMVAVFTLVTPLMLLTAAYATFRESQRGGKIPTTQRFKLPTFDLVASAIAFVPWAFSVPGLFPEPNTTTAAAQSQNVWSGEVGQVFAAFLAFATSWFLSQMRRIWELMMQQKERQLIVASGLFEGRGGHTLKGNFVIEKRESDYWLVTSEDFLFDGSPEPGFALSDSLSPNEGEAIATRFHNLRGSGSLFGTQIEVSGVKEGKIGPDFDLAKTKAIFLWCFLTPFLLGVGPLNAVEGGS